MKALTDFLPLILFFVAYKLYGIYTAVYVMIAASIIQVVATKIISGKFEKMQVIGLAAMVFFGGLTLWFRSPEFIMWKVSVLNIIFGLGLLASIWLAKKPAMAYLMDKQVELARQGWIVLTIIWSVMFFVIALVNAYFVQYALATRAQLLASDTSFTTVDLPTIICQTDICTLAQEAESAWVNFKLFGSMGITVIFLVITVIYIQKNAINKEQI